MSQWPGNMAKQFVDSYRASMSESDQALFDLAVATEIFRRGLTPPAQYAQELRIRSTTYLSVSPGTAALIRAIADKMDPPAAGAPA